MKSSLKIEKLELYNLLPPDLSKLFKENRNVLIEENLTNIGIGILSNYCLRKMQNAASNLDVYNKKV